MRRFFESDRASAALLVLPSVLILALVAGYPLMEVLRLSMHRKLPIFGIDEFIGLGNFRFMLTDPRFWNALKNTAYFTVVAVTLELALGLALALGLRRAFPGRGFLRTAVLVPWAVPTVVSAKLWAWLFDADHGLVRRLLPLRDVDLLGAPGWAMHAAIVVDVWKTTPFVALLLLAGLQTIPGDVRRAAAIDGASAWRTFRSITLPLLRPTLLVALVFRTLDAFRVFDAVYVLTGGGPANTTETLSIYAYKTMMRAGDFGYGATLSVATFLAVMILAAGYMKLLGDREAAR